MARKNDNRVVTEVDKMRMSIELAENGIIIRNPCDEDDITVAYTKNLLEEADLEDSYKAIGRKIFDWLLEDLCTKHRCELTVTGFDLDVRAKCVGRM